MRSLWRTLSVIAFLLPLLAVPLNNAGAPLAPPLVAFLLFWTLRAPSEGSGARAASAISDTRAPL
jgi:hypothetical protein